MTIDEYHETIKPEVQAIWNLHNVALERNLPLDFFTMLSSISRPEGTGQLRGSQRLPQLLCRLSIAIGVGGLMR